MKNHYSTLWELFDDVSKFYKFEVPMVTGGISYETYEKYHFEINAKKTLHVQIYRLSSGIYEYNGYIL